MEETYNYIIEEYKELIYKIANNFYGIDKEDLYQAGRQGLIEAFNNFDDTSNIKFSTYAYKYIYGNMYDLIYKTNDLKITKDTLKLKKKIINAYQELTQMMQRNPTTFELSQYLDVDEYLLVTTMNSNQKAMSLDASYNDDRDLKEIIPTQESVSIEDKLFLQESIASLPQPERQIIDFRYYQDLTQQEIAQKLNMSQVKVSRYEKKGIEKIRSLVKECA